jgi:excisionase family DNA binding protein
MVDSGELLTVADAALRLNRSTEQVRRYLREGRLPGRRIGGQWFIPQDALQSFGGARRVDRGFLDRVRPASESDPLGAIIGIGAGGGSNLAEGKDAYRRALWGRGR